MDDAIQDAIEAVGDFSEGLFDLIRWFCDEEEYNQLIDVAHPNSNTIIIKLTDEDNIAICPKCEEIYDKEKGCC